MLQPDGTAVVEALGRGEARDPDAYYFRTAVTLEAGPGDYAWANRALFVAVAPRGRRASSTTCTHIL